MATDSRGELMGCYTDVSCVYYSKVQRPHSCIAALQERLGVSQQQPVVWIHDVRLPLGHGRSLCLLIFLLLLLLVLIFIRAIKGLVASLLQQGLLQRRWGLSSVLGN